MFVLQIIGNILIGVSVAFMALGVFGIFKFDDFYKRVLIVSKIDTVGMLTLIIGLMLRHGFSFFSGKLLLIWIIMIVLSPLVAHIVLKASFQAGYRLDGEIIEPKELEDLNENEENIEE
ncbi:MAG: monovalent cation/H(+) antiporter subunit G [Defluviitaleaceae bacterium]|nr:monovalent cation/H(+) antiporter subunit G [Defluviitaleaceae bacterium]